MNSRLDGTRALITGGTSGIGFGIAARFISEGARVVVTGRNTTRGERAQTQLGVAATFVPADATDPEAVAKSLEHAYAALGGIDVLVNSAGVALVEKLIDTPTEQFEYVMKSNVNSAFLYARQCFAHLAQTSGNIITLGSDAGLRGEQAIGAYSVSKAAVVMLTKMLALDGAPHGVRSNCICPGATLPGMLHLGPADDRERGDAPDTWALPPLGRHGTAADVASAAAFLASSDAAHVSGAVLLIDGAAGAGLADV